MNWDWLTKAIKDTTLEVLRYLFVWNKQGDAPGPGETEDKLKKKIREDGWGK